MKAPDALVPPAIAKWQFVEEKARGVLDAYCHREVRPPLLAPLAALDAVAAFAQAYVTHMPWQLDPVTRWYSMGPAFRSVPGVFGWQQGHEIAAVVFGAAGAAAQADLYGMAYTLLRECGLSVAQLRLTIVTDAHEQNAAARAHEREVAKLLGAMGIKSQLRQIPAHGMSATQPSSRASDVHPGLEIALVTAAEARPLCRGRCHRHLIESLGGPPTVAVAWELDLGQLVAGLSDADEGYQPAISIMIAPSSAASGATTLRIAQRLRSSGIRTEIDHRSLAPDLSPEQIVDAHLGRAARLGARLVLLVAENSGGSPALTLINLATGQRQAIADDDVELRIAQLLD